VLSGRRSPVSHPGGQPGDRQAPGDRSRQAVHGGGRVRAATPGGGQRRVPPGL